MNPAPSARRGERLARDSRRSRIPLLVVLAGGIAFLLIVFAVFELVETVAAIHAVSALAAVGGIAAFLGDEGGSARRARWHFLSS